MKSGIFRNLCIAIALGAVSGSLSAFFLFWLDWVTETHSSHSNLYWGLLPAGLLIVFLYWWDKDRSSSGNALIHAVYRDQDRAIPMTSVPLIWISTLLTHLTGGSAGREGTAVQMSVGLLGVFTIDSNERKRWIISAVAAGFSGVFGTPLAGILFAFEYLGEKNKVLAFLPTVVIASITAHFACLGWGVRHMEAVIKLNTDDQGFVFFVLLMMGIVFFLVAQMYKGALFRTTDLIAELLPNPFLRIAIGAVLLMMIYFVFNLEAYRGLSLPLMTDSFSAGVNAYSFALKAILTILTLSIGFKGGDVTPLFVIGAALGSMLAELTGIPLSTGAGAGMVTVFCSVYNTPLTGILLAVELFGLSAGLTCSVSLIPFFIFIGFSRGLKF